MSSSSPTDDHLKQELHEIALDALEEAEQVSAQHPRSVEKALGADLAVARDRSRKAGLVTFFWGHMGWLLVENRELNSVLTYDRYARDVLKDPFYFAFERNLLWFWVNLAQGVLFYLAGFAIGWATSGQVMGGVQFGLSLLVWGVILRTVLVWHITWSVNSLSHIWGYRNYETTENSRNNWFVALISNGEGWHNNHHADQRSASHGHRWWEFDITYLTIVLLEKLGLAHDVARPSAKLTSAEQAK